MYRNLKRTVAGANSCSAMGRETIQKSRVSPKNDRSSVNSIIRYPFFVMLLLAIMLIETGCKNNTTKDDANNPANSTEEVNRASGNLEEDYDAWFQLQGKYIEYFALKITEVQIREYSWSKEDLTVALVENVTDKERSGFFVTKGVYFSVAALDEEIAILENISAQMKNEMRKYNCTRSYITSYGITITFQYSSPESKWTDVKIYYSSDKSAVEIMPEYLMNYIEGLKVSKQYIIDFKAGKWSNFN
jgi:hypothetical protein